MLRTLFDDSLFKFWQILTHPPSYKVGGDIKVSKVHSYLEMSPPAISAGATEIAVVRIIRVIRLFMLLWTGRNKALISRAFIMESSALPRFLAN